MARGKPVTLENVKLLFSNFSGAKKEYNDLGDRNFCVILTPEMADGLSRDGWNVKATKERVLDEGEVLGGDPYLKVKVNYAGPRPPKVVVITSRGKTHLGEGEVDAVDYMRVLSADVIINPYDWEANGKTGRAAYLSSIYLTIDEDELERKYADIPLASGAHTSVGEDRDD